MGFANAGFFSGALQCGCKPYLNFKTGLTVSLGQAHYRRISTIEDMIFSAIAT